MRKIIKILIIIGIVIFAFTIGEIAWRYLDLEYANRLKVETWNRRIKDIESTYSVKNPIGFRVINKYVVIDGSIGINLNYCSNKIKPFGKMDKYDCSFKIDSIEYNLREKYIFNNSGKLDSYWLFKSEGPLIYSRKDLENDEKFFNYIGGKDQSVQVYENKIIEKKDTFMIEKILREQKLIFVLPSQNSQNKGERIIYQYK